MISRHELKKCSEKINLTLSIKGRKKKKKKKGKNLHGLSNNTTAQPQNETLLLCQNDSEILD